MDEWQSFTEQMERQTEIPGQLTFVPEDCITATTGLEQPSLQSNEMTLSDPHLISILLCILLHRFEGRLPESWLYDIVVVLGKISYFLYADACGFLLDNHLVISENTAQAGEQYILTPKGIASATNLRQYVPKLFRDRLMLTALRYVSRQKALKELKVDYEPDADGCFLCMRCMDRGQEMMSLRVHAPNRDAAILLCERILRNPARFFGKIIDLALQNEEEEYDLSDN